MKAASPGALCPLHPQHQQVNSWIFTSIEIITIMKIGSKIKLMWSPAAEIFTRCVLPVTEIGIKPRHYLIFLGRQPISMLSKSAGVNNWIPAWLAVQQQILVRSDFPQCFLSLWLARLLSARFVTVPYQVMFFILKGTLQGRLARQVGWYKCWTKSERSRRREGKKCVCICVSASPSLHVSVPARWNWINEEGRDKC